MAQSQLRLGDIATRSQQERFNPVGVNHALVVRPFENCKTAVLRCDERHRIVLIVDELRRRQMPRAAQTIGMDDGLDAAFDGFGDRHLLHLCRPLPP